jgi:hypothetical protein
MSKIFAQFDNLIISRFDDACSDLHRFQAVASAKELNLSSAASIQPLICYLKNLTPIVLFFTFYFLLLTF